MRKPANMLFLAVLIAALGSALVYRYLRVQQDELDLAKKEALGSIIEVAVADAEIPIGAEIQEGQVKMVRWPKESEPIGAIFRAEDAVGKTARVTLRRNQPILSIDIASETAGLLPLLITEGLRAMSVKVDRVTGVSGFITPNSRVDVLATGEVGGSGDREARSKLILQNITVLATGTSIEQRDEGAVEVPTVTLLVKPADAEKLTLAAKANPVQLALRNFRDEEAVATPGQTMQALFGVSEAPKPVPVAAAAPAVARPVVRPSMEILLGEEVTRQSY